MQRTSVWVTAASFAVLIPALYQRGEVRATPAHDHDRGCSAATLRGTYAIRRTGVDNVFAGGPIAQIAIAFYDGDGKRGLIRTSRSSNGEILPWTNYPTNGTYTVAADCTGSLFNADGSHSNNLVLFDGGKRFFLLSVDPGTIVTEEGWRLEAEE